MIQENWDLSDAVPEEALAPIHLNLFLTHKQQSRQESNISSIEITVIAIDHRETKK
jgi:hypothetical protein